MKILQCLKILDNKVDVLINVDRLNNSFKNTKVQSVEFDIGDIELRPQNIKKNTEKCLKILDNKVDVLINNAFWYWSKILY